MRHQEYLKLVLLLCFIGIVSMQNLNSIGDMQSEGFIWATGVPVLSFRFDYFCSVNCRYNWFLGGVQVGSVDTALCDELETYARLKCDVAGGYVNSTLTIEQQFNVVGVTELRVVPIASSSVTKQITIQNCTASSGNINTTTSSISSGATCGYNCSTEIICVSPYVAEVTNPIAVCQYDATWLQVNSCIVQPTTTAAATTTMNNGIVTTDSGSPQATGGPVTTSRELGPGAIVGIVIGALVGVLLILFLIWWFSEAFRSCLHDISDCFPEDHCCGKEYSKGSSS